MQAGNKRSAGNDKRSVGNDKRSADNSAAGGSDNRLASPCDDDEDRAQHAVA